MRARWMVAIAAGAALSVAPMEVAGQGRGQTRQEQVRAAEREAERERLRQQRERERQVRATTARGRISVDPRENERERRRDDRDSRRDERGWDPRDIYENDRARNGNGPPFCRNGQGHPVHGREWCREKGWGLGNSRDVFGDIIFRQPRDRRYDDRTLGRGTLADILGSVILGRFESYGSQFGAGAINGRWLEDYGTRMLQLNIGSVPIARLVDSNRDGRVDDIVLRR